jgi:Integrase zinc binding domain/Integrase core domain
MESVPTPGPALKDAVLDPITLHELIDAQAQDSFCLSKVFELDGATMKRHFVMNDKDLLVQLSPFDDDEQVLVPRCLANRVMCLAHLPLLAAHPGGTRMYATLRKSFYWLTMAKDIYQIVANCPSCAKSRLKRNRRTNYLKLFPPSQPLEFISLDILGPLPVTKSGNKYLVVFGDRYSKAMRVVAVTNITTETLARASVLDWVAVDSISLLLLTDNGTQFVSKLFQTVCRLLGVKKMFTTSYNPSTNGLVERFNQTVLKSVKQFVSEHQDD